MGVQILSVIGSNRIHGGLWLVLWSTTRSANLIEWLNFWCNNAACAAIYVPRVYTRSSRTTSTLAPVLPPNCYQSEVLRQERWTRSDEAFHPKSGSWRQYWSRAPLQGKPAIMFERKIHPLSTSCTTPSMTVLESVSQSTQAEMWVQSSMGATPLTSCYLWTPVGRLLVVLTEFDSCIVLYKGGGMLRADWE